jgi:hypothetical protein
MKTDQEQETIGKTFVKHCCSGKMLDRKELFQDLLRKEPGFSAVAVEPVYRDANRGPKSRRFFEDFAKTKARVNYWRIIHQNKSYLLPEPKTATRFADLDIGAIFPEAKTSPSALIHFLPVVLRPMPEEGEWEAVVLNSVSRLHVLQSAIQLHPSVGQKVVFPKAA